MERPAPESVRDWLDAEAGQHLDDADLAFQVVAEGWAPVGAPPFLAARIAQALAAEVRPAGGLDWWSRAGIAAGLCACGVAMGIVPVGTFGSLLLATVEGAASFVSHVFVGMSLAWDAAALVYRPLAWLGYAMRATLAAPLPVSLLIVNVMLAAGAFAALRRVLSVREV